MKTYEVTLALHFPEVLAMQYAMERTLEDVQIAAANEERRADQYKAHGLTDDEAYHRHQMARYEERAVKIRAALAALAEHTA